jgi:hypothetical protein
MTVGASAVPLQQAGSGDVRDFIEAVLGDQRGNVVMGLVGGRMPTGKPIINRARWFTYPQQIGDMVRLAEQHAEEDVYLSPIVYGDQRDAKGRITRAKTNALTSRAIYMDSDTCPPDAFRLPPSIHVDSSPGHGQDYWLLAEPIPAPRAAAIAHRISLAHKADGTDPSGWSSSKFLRIPTVNLSYGEPFPVQWRHTGEVYVDLDVEGAYDDVVLPPDFSEPDLAEPAATAVAVPPRTGGVPEVLDGEALAPLYDRVPASNARLIDLLEHSPKVGDKGWRSEQRWGLLLELMRTGFDDQETLSLAWHAEAASKWREDPRGVTGLWGEVIKARAHIEAETGGSVPAAERRALHTSAPKILTEEERQATLVDGHFLQRYVDWARTRVGVVNQPLHEMNAWTYLSVIWCEVAHVWRREGGLPLNLYSVSIAESSSGKSESARLMMQAINAAFPHESPQIASDQSKNALIENLLLRDGAVAFARSDEADATFRQQRDAPWAQGVQQAWTEVYDGFVPQQGRRGADPLLSKANVRAHVVMHHVGTPDALYDVLDRSLFRSGYLQRHVWTHGVAIPPTKAMTDFPNPDEVKTLDSTLTPRYWADQAWRARNRVEPSGMTSRAIYLTREATERMNDARWLVKQHLNALPDQQIFVSMANRVLEYILKAATLVALADDSTVVTRRHMVRGLAAVEHWLASAIRVVDNIASSAFSRAADDIERYVAGREGREADAQRIYALMKGYRPKEVDEWLDSLVKQGRLEAILPKAGGSRKYRYKGEVPK